MGLKPKFGHDHKEYSEKYKNLIDEIVPIIQNFKLDYLKDFDWIDSFLHYVKRRYEMSGGEYSLRKLEKIKYKKKGIENDLPYIQRRRFIEDLIANWENSKKSYDGDSDIVKYLFPSLIYQQICIYIIEEFCS